MGSKKSFEGVGPEFMMPFLNPSTHAWMNVDIT